MSSSNLLFCYQKIKEKKYIHVSDALNNAFIFEI